MRDRRIEITPMQAADLDQVVAIEALCQPSPWPRQVFAEELDREWARLDVVRHRGPDGVSEVVAFCNYWLVKGEIHILNLATHPDHQRRGHAALLMRHLLAYASGNDCGYLTLEVRRSNVAAIALYESFGFAGVGVRPRYYVENAEDAIVMALELSAAS